MVGGVCIWGKMGEVEYRAIFCDYGGRGIRVWCMVVRKGSARL